jgi:hypothetical protein
VWVKVVLYLHHVGTLPEVRGMVVGSRATPFVPAIPKGGGTSTDVPEGDVSS